MLRNKYLNLESFKLTKILASQISGKEMDFHEIDFNQLAHFDFINKLEMEVLSDHDLSLVRAIFDRKALIFCYHDKKIQEEFQNDVFLEKCEIARLETIGSQIFTGVKFNLNANLKHLFFIRDFDSADMVNETNFDDIFYIILRLKLENSEIHPNFLELANHLAPKIDDLKKTLHDQKKFLGIMKEFQLVKEKFTEKIEIETDSPSKKHQKESSFESSASPSSGTSSEIHEKSTSYNIYTTEFDKILKAEELATQKELLNLRKSLDLKLKEIKSLAQKQAQELKAKLILKRNIVWESQKEEGILDANSFTKLIIDPNYSLNYKEKIMKSEQNAVLTLLIDNSGSMRGKPIAVAAIISDILTKMLETCDIRVEILGFTTKEWSGGEPRKLWERSNKPRNPGRLNSLLHIIYKSAEKSWRLSRKNFGLMLKDGILKENIDGEALIWASNRLLKWKNHKKILCVISDGFPVDDSTIQENDPDFLDQHLRKVTKQIEQKTPIHLISIGIGVDTAKIYQNSIRIESTNELSTHLFKKLAEIL